MHHDFLSGFKPVFYLRQRGYSKTVNVAPFVVNYDGAIFRTYPAGWQVGLSLLTHPMAFYQPYRLLSTLSPSSSPTRPAGR